VPITDIYTIMNRITANIAWHICQCAASFRISAVLDAQHWLWHFRINCSYVRPNNMPAFCLV